MEFENAASGEQFVGNQNRATFYFTNGDKPADGQLQAGSKADF
jgi:hypothetical protein